MYIPLMPREVRVDEALPIAVDATQHARPRLADAEQTAGVGRLLLARLGSAITASMPKNGSVHEPGTVGVAPGSGVIM